MVCDGLVGSVCLSVGQFTAFSVRDPSEDSILYHFMITLASSIHCSVLLFMATAAAAAVESAATNMSGDLLVIRHGQRYPLKRITGFDAVFDHVEVRWGELTPHGAKQMSDLGSNTEALIVRALYSDNNRCKESLTEFLAGAGGQIAAETFGDVNYGSFSDLLQDKAIHQEIIDAFARHIRDRDSFEGFVKKFEPSSAHAGPLICSLLGAAIVDAFAVFQDMGIQDMNLTVRDLDFDCALAMTHGMRRTYVNQLQEVVLQTTKMPISASADMTMSSKGTTDTGDPSKTATVLMASDVHLLALLQTLVPLWAKVRPDFGDILRIRPLTSGVQISFHNMTELMSWENFNARMATLVI